VTTHTLTTPRGRPAQLEAREGTSDLSVLGSTFAGVAGSGLIDEYQLADTEIVGRFVDVGAHIGSVTIAVLLDNPEATALLVEPIPENISAITANLAANGLLDRAQILIGAVGTDTIHYGFEGSEVATTNRFIGNLNIPLRASQVAKVRHVTLSDLLPCAAMKMDCEGGEWSLLADPRIAEIPLIFGEYHGNPGAVGITNALAKTHRVTFQDMTLSTGNFRAVAR
jgi:FkbM family methyltransferase